MVKEILLIHEEIIQENAKKCQESISLNTILSDAVKNIHEFVALLDIPKYLNFYKK